MDGNALLGLSGLLTLVLALVAVTLAPGLRRQAQALRGSLPDPAWPSPQLQWRYRGFDPALAERGRRAWLARRIERLEAQLPAPAEPAPLIVFKAASR